MLKRSLLVIAQGGLVLLWFIFLRPHILGGPASYIIVVGSSMEPTLIGGDLAIAFRRNSYGAGDLVAFRVPAREAGEGALVIHRIVGNEAKGFVTQGDNASAPDSWTPTADDILGRMWLAVPGGGRALAILRQPVILGAIAGVLGMLFVLSEGKKPGQRRSVHGPGRLAVWVRAVRPRGSSARTSPTVSMARSKAPSSASNGHRRVVTHVNEKVVRPASRAELWKAMQKDGRRTLRKELPPNARVYVVWEGAVTRWQVVAEDRSSERGTWR